MRKLLVGLALVSSTFMFAASNEAPAVPVKAFTVNSDVVTISKKYPATIKAEKSVDIIARVSGALEKRYFVEGDFVKKGQKLYTIEQRTYQANIDSTRAAVNRAKSLVVKLQMIGIDIKNYMNKNQLVHLKKMNIIITTKMQLQMKKMHKQL